MYLLKEEREISLWWDDMVCFEISAAANSAFEEFKAEQAALAKKAQPQVGNLYRISLAARILFLLIIIAPCALEPSIVMCPRALHALALVILLAEHVFSPFGILWLSRKYRFIAECRQ